MGKVTGEEGWTSLGPWGPWEWAQMPCEASYKADGPVMEITVHYSQLSPVSDTNYIDAISFQSESYDGVLIGCSEIIGSSRGKRTKKVRIDSSVEQLLSISLTHNTFYMTSLTFHTNINKYGPIGPFDEKDTTFSMPMDVGVIVGFHGCGEVDGSNRLSAIGVFVVPKAKSLHSIQDPYSGPSKDKKIEEELKSKIKELEDKEGEFVMKMKEVDAKNEVLRKRNEEMEKAVADLQKIEEELKIEMKDVATENEVLRKSNEVMEKKIKIVEGGIPLGPWGGTGGSPWTYKTNVAPVMEITLCYGAIIDSVLITNKSCNGDVIGCSNKIGGPGGEHHKTFRINNSLEQLTSISLTYKNLYGEETITSLCFHSNRDRYGPYGTVCGPAVSIPIEGAVLAGFHGRFGTFLNAIGIFVAPKSTQ